MAAARQLDIIVFGATGFTGQMVTRHLAERAPIENIKWGIAGRSKDKLNALLLDVNAPSDTLVMCADAGNPAELDLVCQKATVVIACAGPFIKYGMPIVDACLRQGTHYCDITGENNYVRLMIEKHHDAATKAGLLLVPQSGFDSVPGDLCNFLVNDYAAKNGQNVTDVVSFYRTGSGGPSRGTFDTLLEMVSGAHNAKEDRSPVSLNPADKRKNIKVNKPWAFPKYAGKSVGWATLWVMAKANVKIVRRTNAILGYNSSYDEAMQCKNLFQAVLTFVGMATFFALMSIAPIRNFLAPKISPKAGGGPSDATDKSPFYVTANGKTDQSGKVVQVKLKCDVNAYPATAIMVVQTALAIAHDIVRDGKPTGLVGANIPKAGVLTPMTAVGPLLLPRLQRNKFTIEGAKVVQE